LFAAKETNCWYVFGLCDSAQSFYECICILKVILYYIAGFFAPAFAY
jgi:hypothetical protein